MKDCPDFMCFKCEERGHFARDCNAVRCPDCRMVLSKCECEMENEHDEEEQAGGQMHEEDNEEQEEETSGTQRIETTGNKDIDEQRMEYSGQEEAQTQQEGHISTQMDKTECMESALDTMEQNEQGNEEHIVAKGNIEEEEKEVQSTKRRRSTKVTPNVGIARKKTPKDNIIKIANRYERLEDLEEKD